MERVALSAVGNASICPAECWIDFLTPVQCETLLQLARRTSEDELAVGLSHRDEALSPDEREAILAFEEAVERVLGCPLHEMDSKPQFKRTLPVEPPAPRDGATESSSSDSSSDDDERQMEQASVEAKGRFQKGLHVDTHNEQAATYVNIGYTWTWPQRTGPNEWAHYCASVL